ncbi:MAG: MFS transporter [Lachnospiraceae bacterium]|nr:MFS transporter [Lachnospiraceae bacterium]
MLNLKKQINTLYITSVLDNLSITGAWVAILAARGFSLVEIGLAETCFHITSLIFEIPSGLMADIYGRKKMLLVSNLMTFVGNIVMVLSNSLGLVCLSISFHALGYNFASGSGEALAYDSMKLSKAESGYEKYVSNQSVIYRIASGISTLVAGVALLIGYRPAYLLSAVSSAVTFAVTLRLKEVMPGSEECREPLRGSRLKALSIQVVTYFRDSLIFLVNNRRATKLMFANSFVGAIDVLLVFFLQSTLMNAGISDWALGIALFIMQLGGVAGARLVLKLKDVRYVRVFIICTIGVISSVILEHTKIAAIMVLGGFLSTLADDALQIRSDALLQGMFPSDQRATLISISSFTFSVIMIVLSPLAGYFFSVW